MLVYKEAPACNGRMYSEELVIYTYQEVGCVYQEAGCYVYQEVGCTV